MEHEHDRIPVRVIELLEMILAAIDDLNNSVTNLQAADTAIEAKVDTLTAEVANAGAANDPAIAAAAQAVQAVADQLNAKASA